MRFPTLLAPFSCDVLIYDSLGSSWIHHCIPDSASRELLDIRDARPIFCTRHFFHRLTKHYLTYRKSSQEYRFLSYVFALLDQINPRVIITFADNNVVLGHYAKQNPSTLVISIQNAIRGTVDSIPPKTMLPVYFSLGNAEQKVFDEISITRKEYVPVGSVKLGLFLKNRDGDPNEQWDLSFCSHYRPELVAHDASRLFQLIDDAQRHLFLLTCRYARVNSLSIAVLSKTREPDLQKLELKYFEDIADGYPFTLILGDKFDKEFATYEAAFSSRLVINLCSTLGYEAFGAGRKVLFGSGYRTDLLSDWGAHQYYDELPDFVCLFNDSYTCFSENADNLLEMDLATYNRLSNSAAKYYLAMPFGCYPHEAIRERLANHLNSTKHQSGY